MTAPAYHPQVRELLDRIARANRAPWWTLTPQVARVDYEKATPILDIWPASVGKVEDKRVRVAGGFIRARVYWPEHPSTGSLPGLLWTHGGGYTLGSVASYDALCRMFCRRAGCVVVSVEYRLAPEYPFPTAVEDAFAALRWMREEARWLGLDLNRIAVAGDSAGGTLAAVNAIRAAQAGWPLCLQLLIYPGTYPFQDGVSHRQFASDPLLSQQLLSWFYAHYVRNEADRLDWRFAPLLAADLAGIAPAWIATAQCDILADEGQAYASRLRENGVPVTHSLYEGMVHGFFQMARYLETGAQAHTDAVMALQAAFAKAPAA